MQTFVSGGKTYTELANGDIVEVKHRSDPIVKKESVKKSSKPKRRGKYSPLRERLTELALLDALQPKYPEWHALAGARMPRNDRWFATHDAGGNAYRDKDETKVVFVNGLIHTGMDMGRKTMAIVSPYSLRCGLWCRVGVHVDVATGKTIKRPA